MNCTTATTETSPTNPNPTEVPYFKAKCNRAGIYVPGDNPTPFEIVPIIEQRLAAHQKRTAKTMNPWTGDYCEWKQINDDLNDFLHELRAAAEPQKRAADPKKTSPEAQEGRVRCPQRTASVQETSSNPPASSVQQSSPTHPTTDATHSTPATNKNENNFPRENCGQTEQPIPTEQNSNWPDSGQTLANVGQSLPNDGQPRPDTCRPLPKTGQTSSQELPHEHDQPENPDLNEEDHDEEAEDGDEEDQDELDFDAEQAGYANHAELMAEAAADLQAALNKRNKFDALSPEAQAAIITLLDKYDSRYVAKLLIKPPPIGMNFKISKSGLNYFRRRYEKVQSQRRASENAKAAAELLDKSEDPDKTFQQTLERLLRLRALTTISEPNAPLETIDALITSLNKLRKQTLAERKQQHAEKTQKQKTAT